MRLLVFLVLVVVCGGGVCAALIDSSLDGPFSSGGTNLADYNSLADGMYSYVGNSANTTTVHVSCSFGTCLWVPKYSSSTDLGVMNGCNGQTKAAYTMTTNFMVTDEFSQAMQVASMGNNGTRMKFLVNTVRWINSSGDGHGVLPEWCVSIDNNVLNRSNTNDVASDADARVIDSLYTCSTGA